MAGDHTGPPLPNPQRDQPHRRSTAIRYRRDKTMSAPNRRRLQRHHRAGFLAGLLAGGVLTAVMFVLARALDLFSLPELLGYRLIALMPLNLFSTIVETFRG